MITRRFILIAALFGATLYALLTWNPGGAVVQIDVEASGAARVEGASLDLEALEADLRARLDDNPALMVLIQADRTTSAGHVLAVMDAAKQAGAVNIEIEAGS